MESIISFIGLQLVSAPFMPSMWLSILLRLLQSFHTAGGIATPPSPRRNNAIGTPSWKQPCHCHSVMIQCHCLDVKHPCYAPSLYHRNDLADNSVALVRVCIFCFICRHMTLYNHHYARAPYGNITYLSAHHSSSALVHPGVTTLSLYGNL